MTTEEYVAKEFHDAYERLAPLFGYETRKESAVPWDDVPDTNKALMIAVVVSLFEKEVISFNAS